MNSVVVSYDYDCSRCTATVEAAMAAVEVVHIDAAAVVKATIAVEQKAGVVEVVVAVGVVAAERTVEGDIVVAVAA